MFLDLLIKKIININSKPLNDFAVCNGKKASAVQEQAILDYLFENNRNDFEYFFAEENFEQKNAARKKYSGYTLMEVVISVVFFGIVVLGLGLPISQSLGLSTKDQNIVSANNLARVYLRDLELSWLKQSDFDGGQILEISDKYTNNGYYDVTLSTDTIATNSEGNIIVRRVNIKYTDSSDICLADIFLDYNRPGSSLE